MAGRARAGLLGVLGRCGTRRLRGGLAASAARRFGVSGSGVVRSSVVATRVVWTRVVWTCVVQGRASSASWAGSGRADDPANAAAGGGQAGSEVSGGCQPAPRPHIQALAPAADVSPGPVFPGGAACSGDPGDSRKTGNSMAGQLSAPVSRLPADPSSSSTRSHRSSERPATGDCSWERIASACSPGRRLPASSCRAGRSCPLARPWTPRWPAREGCSPPPAALTRPPAHWPAGPRPGRISPTSASLSRPPGSAPLPHRPRWTRTPSAGCWRGRRPRAGRSPRQPGERWL